MIFREIETVKKRRFFRKNLLGLKFSEKNVHDPRKGLRVLEGTPLIHRLLIGTAEQVLFR